GREVAVGVRRHGGEAEVGLTFAVAGGVGRYVREELEAEGRVGDNGQRAADRRPARGADGTGQDRGRLVVVGAAFQDNARIIVVDSIPQDSVAERLGPGTAARAEVNARVVTAFVEARDDVAGRRSRSPDRIVGGPDTQIHTERTI